MFINLCLESSSYLPTHFLYTSEHTACVFYQALEDLGGRLDGIQPAVESCHQRAEHLQPNLADQDREIIRRQSQV